MRKEDMTFGVSQLQSIDERSEGWIVPADAEIYWKHATKLKRIKAEEISKIKVIGRGGTMFAQFFDNYKKEMDEVDFLIVITDGYLLDTDIAEMKDPGVDVIWLVTSGSSFSAPFGRVFDIKNI
jgi:predicted metal-dependent peptidase